MTQTLNKHVKINVPYKVKARKTGKYDLYEDLTITKDGPRDFNYTMTDYDGLSCSFDFSNDDGIVDSSNTVLPWKYDYNNKFDMKKSGFGNYKSKFVIHDKKSIFNGLPTTMTNGNAWKLEDNKIRNGSKSYHVDSGISVGYIQYTPEEDFVFTASGYVSSEASYDYGGLYIGTTNWTPTREQITSKTVVGTGSWLFMSSGSNSFTNTTYNMTAGTTYYIIFCYTKDGSGNTDEDSFVVTSCNLQLDYLSEEYGCLYHYEDTTKEAVTLKSYVINKDERLLLSDIDATVEDINYRKYYKYVYEDFEQPILTSNGTMGGSNFACNQSSAYETYYAYLALSGSGSFWHSAESIPAWISWYNPNPLKITNLYFEVGNGSSYPDLPKEYYIQGSNDNINWTTVYSATNTTTSTIPLPINIDLSSITNNTFKYWRYYVSSVLGRSFGNMRNMKITAKEKKVIEGTAEDYDYYEDVTFDSLDYLGTVDVPSHKE